MPTGRSSGPLFFFNDTATTEIYTLSLHDALPIYRQVLLERGARGLDPAAVPRRHRVRAGLGGHRAGGVPGGDEDVLPHRRAVRRVRVPRCRALVGAAGGGAAAAVAGPLAAR